jgi:hypothetical protein
MTARVPPAAGSARPGSRLSCTSSTFAAKALEKKQPAGNAPARKLVSWTPRAIRQHRDRNRENGRGEPGGPVRQPHRARRGCPPAAACGSSTRPAAPAPQSPLRQWGQRRLDPDSTEPGLAEHGDGGIGRVQSARQVYGGSRAAGDRRPVPPGAACTSPSVLRPGTDGVALGRRSRCDFAAQPALCLREPGKRPAGPWVASSYSEDRPGRPCDGFEPQGVARVTTCVPPNDLTSVSRSASSVAVAVQRTRTSRCVAGFRGPSASAGPAQFTGIAV